MTVDALYRSAVADLENNRVPDAAFDCACLVEAVFGLGRTERFRYGERQAAPQEVAYFQTLIARRIAGEPLQYLLGVWDFYDMTFFVGEGVLIPRPETEKLVDIGLSYLAAHPNAVVYDLCAGSGCIGLTLAKHFPDSRVYLLEYSKKALVYTRKNREKYALDNAEILEFDITCGFPALCASAPDLLLSNPPYIAAGELPTLQREVRREPVMALDGGEDGLDFYRVIAEKWLPFLQTGSLAAVETGEGQPPLVAKLFSRSLTGLQILPDCYGTDRFVCGQKGDN